MYKISEQKNSQKCCQSPIPAIIMRIPKMAKIVFRQMPAPRDLPQSIPALRTKITMQKPQSGGKFSVQIPEGVRRVVVMVKLHYWGDRKVGRRHFPTGLRIPLFIFKPS